MLQDSLKVSELIGKRTERGKVFSLGLRRFLFEGHCKPIHYKAPSWTQWEAINPNFTERSGKLECAENKVRTEVKADKTTSKLLLLEDWQNRRISLTPLKVWANEVVVTELSADSVLSKAEQVGDYEAKLTAANGAVIESYNNEVSNKLFYVFPQQIDSLNITLQVVLEGDLVCLNKKNKEGVFAPDQYGCFNFGSAIDKEPVPIFWIKPPYWTDAAGMSYQSLTHSLAEVGGELIYTKSSTKAFADESAKAQYPIKVDASTYYADTNDGNVRLDGYNGTWANAVAQSTGTTVDSGTYFFSSAFFTNRFSTFNYIYRSFFMFDTSDLPDNAVVTSAIISLYGSTNNSGSKTIHIQEGTQATTLTTADFDNFTGSTFGDSGGSWSTSAYNNITLNASGRSAVSKTGYTKYCGREREDYNVSFSTSGTCGCYYANETGTTKDPKLVLEYTTPLPGINQPLWFS